MQKETSLPKDVSERVEYVLSDLYLVLLKIFLSTCEYVARTYHRVCSLPNYLQDACVSLVFNGNWAMELEWL